MPFFSPIHFANSVDIYYDFIITRCMQSSKLFVKHTTDNFLGNFSRLANRPRMAGIVPELTHGVPGEAHFVPEMWKLTTGHKYMAVH